MPVTELSPDDGPKQIINRGEAMEARDNEEIEGFEIQISGQGDVVFAHTEQTARMEGGRRYPPGREGVMDPKGQPVYAKAVGDTAKVQHNRAGFAFNLFPSISLNSLDYISTVDTVNSVSTVGEVTNIDNTEDLRETGTISDGLDETTAQEAEMYLAGRNTLEVYAKADSATDFYLDVSPDGNYWVTGVNPAPDMGSWSSSNEVMWGGFVGFAHARLRSDAAGASGDTVDLILGGAR